MKWDRNEKTFLSPEEASVLIYQFKWGLANQGPGTHTEQGELLLSTGSVELPVQGVPAAPGDKQNLQELNSNPALPCSFAVTVLFMYLFISSLPVFCYDIFLLIKEPGLCTNARI